MLDTTGVNTTNTERGPYVSAYSGRNYYPLSFSAEDINIDDVSRALAFQCRFNGQCKFFFSVAEHSVNCSFLAEELYGEEAAKLLLLHDAPEAYIGDLIRPLKVILKDYIEIENKIWKCFVEKYNLVENHKIIKGIDNVMLATEKKELLPNSCLWDNMPEPLEIFKIEYMGPENARRLFINRFNELFID